MQQTQALAEPPSFVGGTANSSVPPQTPSPKRKQVWRARLAVGALLGVSVAGYAVALICIDAVVKGNLPALF